MLRTAALSLAGALALTMASAGSAVAHGLGDALAHLDEANLSSLAVVDESKLPKLVLPVALPGADMGTGSSVDAALRWLQSTYGLTPVQAERRLAAESQASETAQLLEAVLGGDAAGFWIDQATGDLVAGVTSDEGAQLAELAGATPRRVRHSSAELAAAQGTLDQRARTHDLDGAGDWYVDPPRNQLVVEVLEGLDDRIRRMLAAALGDLEMVQIRPIPAVPALQAGRLLGGHEIEISADRVCSTAFNAEDGRGRDVVLTAGHCLEDIQAVTFQGSKVGAVGKAVFPDSDFGLVRTNTDDWSPVGAVDGYDGNEHAVAGSTSVPVGGTVCKSGRSSGWTCGSVQAHGATVQYQHGELVYGLTKETACSLDGDSGGAVMAGEKAVGIVSGGQTMLGGCLALLGMDNVSFYQPIGEVLDHLNVTLLTQR